MEPTTPSASAFCQPSDTVLCCKMVRPVALGSGASSLPASRISSRELATPIAKRDWPIYQAVLAGLREFCPPALPVVVRSARVPAGSVGDCGRKDRKFVIRLSNQLDEERAIEVLIHEWAHALSWNFEIDRCARSRELTPHEFQTMIHGPAWGVALSRVWQLYQEILVTMETLASGRDPQ